MQCVSLQFTSVRADPMCSLDHLQTINPGASSWYQSQVFMQPRFGNCQGRVIRARVLLQAGIPSWARISVKRWPGLLPAGAVLALDHAFFWHLGHPAMRCVRPVFVLDNIPKATLLASWLDISPFASHRVYPICQAY